MKHHLKSRGRDGSSGDAHPGSREEAGSAFSTSQPETPGSPSSGSSGSEAGISGKDPDAEGTGGARSARGNAPDLEGSPGMTLTPGGPEALAELKDKWLRAEADLQNVRRRARRDLEEGLRFAEEQTFLEIISWVDDLERALEVARESGGPENWVQGVQLVAQRMTEYLARRDVKATHPLGETFDPRFHEALVEIDSADAPAGSVIQVVRKGYQRGDRALRAARVVVARRPSGSES